MGEPLRAYEAGQELLCHDVRGPALHGCYGICDSAGWPTLPHNLRVKKERSPYEQSMSAQGTQQHFWWTNAGLDDVSEDNRSQTNSLHVYWAMRNQCQQSKSANVTQQSKQLCNLRQIERRLQHVFNPHIGVKIGQAKVPGPEGKRGFRLEIANVTHLLNTGPIMATRLFNALILGSIVLYPVSMRA